MSGLCKKSNGLLNYFARVESSKKVSFSSTDQHNIESSNSLKAAENNDIETIRGDQEGVEDLEKEDAMISGGKRKRSYTKKSRRQSDGTNTKTLRPRGKSETPKHDSDSDFEEKEVTKRPKRKFKSVPNGVKSISSYFVLSSGSQTTTDCSLPISPPKVVEVIDDCIQISQSTPSTIASEDIEIVKQDHKSVSKNDSETVQVTQDTPARRRSCRIQNIEERKEKESEVKKDQMLQTNKIRPRARRNRQISSESDSEDSLELVSEDDGEESLNSGGSDQESFQKRRKNKVKGKRVNGKIPLMFLTGKDREKELLRLKNEKRSNKPDLDAETLAFLQSGVPDVVLKAQKQVEKKLEFEDYLNTVEFFPKISHTGLVSSYIEADPFSFLPFKEIKTEEIFDIIFPHSSWKDTFDFKNNSVLVKNGIFCCGNTAFTRFNSTLEMKTYEVDKTLCSGIPWVEKYKVNNKKDLVIDKEAFSKLEKWLRQWKTDIKDDGGTGRKEVKKKKKDSDSDFVTSDEEDNAFMNKSVLLCGSTGCGKTTAVYVLAKHLGFYVVEVNFSSRRSGKEVLQRVEEATLSHRLESSESCLLLFKDIDLLHPEEDEGFHAAVAQLISSSCRPIVMTTQQDLYSPLDAKIEKKDPLRIYFDRPSPSEIAKRVLLPMCKSSILNFNADDEKLLSSGLNSLVRHLHCDIRLSINQAQLLCFDNFFNSENIHKHCNLKENCVDLDFICKAKTNNFIHAKSGEKNKKEMLNELEEIMKDLSFLGDIELISNKIQSSDHCDKSTSNFNTDFLDHLEQSVKSVKFRQKSICISGNTGNENTNPGIDFDSYNASVNTYRKLALLNDDDEMLARRVSDLSEELGSYCDTFDDWQSWGCVRTIVKTNAMNSVGRTAKRNGRMAFYFNRLDRDLVDKICSSFGFSQELEIAKMFAPS